MMRFVSKTIHLLSCWLFLPAALVFSGYARADDLGDLPQKPHLVIDAGSGMVVSHKRAFDRWAPASLTKLMTVYTIFRAIELGHLDMKSPVRISEEAFAEPPSRIGLPIGSILTLETAMKIIMVKSANDLSVALAQAVSGSEEQFVALMNSHARRLGLTDTQFTNPHGLHDPEQYTTARDMGALALQLTNEFPQYADFFDIPAIRFNKRRLRNHNALLRLYEGTNGMKTGYVCASGFNVIVRTTRGERTLIAVVLGGRSGLRRNIRAARVLSEAFVSAEKPSVPFADFVDTPANSDFAHDMTNEVCPFKYSREHKPDQRPAEAPRADAFDAIDTRIVIEGERQTLNPEKLLTALQLDLVPTKRPELSDDISAAASDDVKDISSDDVQATSSDGVRDTSSGGVQATPPEEVQKAQIDFNEERINLREQAEQYFVPATGLRPDLELMTGGATGLNPNGIQHTNGGNYVAPIPVPNKRPAPDLQLDLQSTSE